MKLRNPGIDALRIFAILAIITGHVWPTPIMHKLLYPWHVPVFFFLTGYLWNSNRTFTEEVTRRSNTLIKPYLFWGIIIYVLYAAALYLRKEATHSLLLAPIYGGRHAGGPFGTFWFVFALFSTAVLWRTISNTPVLARAIIVAVGVIAGIFYGPELASTPLSIGSALPALSFVAAGQVARRATTPRTVVAVPTAMAVIALCATLTLTGISEPMGLKQGNWGIPVVSGLIAITISWSLVVVFEALTGILDERGGALITHFALTGFTVVLLHPTVIAVGSAAHAPSWATFAISVIAPVVVGLIALRTPLSPWATGVPHRRSNESAPLAKR